jgi:hypothetical protein
MMLFIFFNAMRTPLFGAAAEAAATWGIKKPLFNILKRGHPKNQLLKDISSCATWADILYTLRYGFCALCRFVLNEILLLHFSCCFSFSVKLKRNAYFMRTSIVRSCTLVGFDSILYLSKRQKNRQCLGEVLHQQSIFRLEIDLLR